MSMLARTATTGGALPTYVDDVFSTYLYTGTGSDQTLTTGINLSTHGGLIWSKRRSNAENHFLQDTNRGLASRLSSNTSGAAVTSGSWPMNSISTTGMIVSGVSYAAAGETYVSWVFRKAPKFFDVVTYTGNGTQRSIAHNLGVAPGCIIVKRTDVATDWVVYHSGLSPAYFGFLNFPDAWSIATGVWGNTSATDSNFTVGTSTYTNSTGGTYIAYLFAHDTAADGLIQCGSHVTSASASTWTSVNLGWEPQWILIKTTTTSVNWHLVDVMRRLDATGTSFSLFPNSTGSDQSYANAVRVTSTGFEINSGFLGTSQTLVYVAIRRPNKPPTSGTQVYENVAYTGDGAAQRQIGSSVRLDLLLLSDRDATSTSWGTYAHYIFDRLRSDGLSLATASTAAELSGLSSEVDFDTNFGWDTASSSSGYTNKLNTKYVSHIFRRAPGFFDVVCYTGTGSNTTQTHNLSVVPEMIIIAARNGTPSRRWSVGHKINSFAGGCELNTNGAMDNNNFTYFASTAPTASVFSLPNIVTNDSGVNYVAYLFASLPGVSKVGSYTGNGGTVNTNGTAQTINCGFSGGARFVLIKRTDSTGDWYTFDTARGIVAASDPYLRLNSSAAEVTSVDAVDPDNSGFIVNQTSGTNLNVTSATYIYLAIA